MTGIHPDNQAPELKDYNVYTSDPALRRAVERGGAQWRDAELVRQGAEYGAEATLRAAEDANHFEPELHTHSRTGERIDQVRFHPAWHTMMSIARRNGIANLPFFDERPSAWSAYAASLYMHSQIESGSTCPTTMTKACIPLMRLNAPLYAATGPLLASMEHDARDLPLTQKRSMTVGMGMTEKQGGSDVRTNTTRAVPAGDGAWGPEFLITGHKWFFSAPMCDGHLVLAKTDERGSTCFFVPRWRPDGGKNAVHIQRLKDKVGNRSNSSSEVEFKEASGVLVGEEGRGISTIIEMATYTRLDCALSSAGFIRQAFAQALHYTRNRHAFGKALVDQPVMTELLADMALESEAATLLAMDLAIALRLRRRARRRLAPPDDAGGQVLELQARGRPDRRSHGSVRRQRLCGDRSDGAPVPRSAGQFHLGGLGQRDEPGRAARGVAQPRRRPPGARPSAGRGHAGPRRAGPGEQAARRDRPAARPSSSARPAASRSAWRWSARPA